MVSLEFCNIYLKTSRFNKYSNHLFKSNHLSTSLFKFFVQIKDKHIQFVFSYSIVLSPRGLKRGKYRGVSEIKDII